MVKLSVVIPVYNVEKYLDRCINSIINQSYKNWELILIDDGSSDLSGKICDKYLNIDRRIRVFHIKNQGVSNARNLGINVSTGKYITFIDSDDWIEKDLLEKMIVKIEQMNVPILITGFVYEYNGKIKNPFKKGRKQIFTRKEAQIEFLKQNKFLWSMNDKVFERSLFDKYMFDKKIKIGEDMLLLWQLMNEVKYVGYIPLYKYHYDISASKTITSGFSKKWIQFLKIKKYVYCQSKRISRKHEFLAKCIYIADMAGIMRKMINSTKYDGLIKLFQKEIRKNMYISLIFPFCNIMTLRQRLGIVYFSLPFRLCKMMRNIL